MMKNIMATTAAVAAALVALAWTGSAEAAKLSWQGTSTFSPSTGQTDLEYTFNCPTGYTALSGGYEFNSTGQSDDIALGASGPRFDDNNYNAWAWHFYWPNGAMAGEEITFSAVCQK